MIEKTTQYQLGGDRKIVGTDRTDLWWLYPATTFAVFTVFVIYATFRAFENNCYQFENYLSPFCSPKITVGWTLFGFHISPALWVLPFPLLFRLTCYYYRKAYYRTFFWDPPACAVGEPFSRKGYSGEAGFPLVLQNIHRYTWYFITAQLILLWIDAVSAFIWQGGFHIGIGSLIFLLNVIFLSGYVFGCHAWRHLAGGSINCFSRSGSSQMRHGLWEKVSRLNERHGTWAWLSLVSVGFTDFYVRSLCTGLFHEIRFF